ncbi:N,N'-diacetylchitobiose transport system permease protein [Catenulispora sp. EB89]|uniref:carbohydrate ABC transporter permease n=1 Tax=Catenulispora sp. EB89 TaxID=3156257 RepID=UPI003518058E
MSVDINPGRRRTVAPRPGSGRKKGKKAAWNTLGILVFVVMGFPVYWMLNTSLKRLSEWQNYTPHFIPEHPTFRNFTGAFQASNFGIDLWNSVVITLGAVVVSLVVGFFGALAIARFHFAGKKVIIFTVLLVQMVPLIVLVIPVTQTLQNLNMTDTLYGIILTYLVFSVPYTVWTLRGFITNIPRELDEAAMVDGCSRWQTFFRIILPLTGPGLVATSVYGFIQAWNEFILITTINHDPRKQNMMAWLVQTATGSRGTDWGVLMAGATITSIPVVILFLAIQKNIATGLTAGAVKG